MLEIMQPLRAETTARRLCRELFAMTVAVRALPGYADINFAVTDVANGARHVLKLAHPAVEATALQLENAVMRHLAAAGLTVNTPLPIVATNGADIIPIRDAEGALWHVRLLTYVPGRLWSEATPAPAERLHGLGRALAELNIALSDFSHPLMQRQSDWDLRGALQARVHLPLIADPELRATLQTILERFANMQVELEALPRGLIYNDANDNNLLLDAEGRLSGIVDFGDLSRSWRIAELAIASAYVCTGWEDLVAGICHLLAGYHEVSPLQADETDVLRDLILTRLAQSLCNSAAARRQTPDNPYIPISEHSNQQLLRQLLAAPANLATYQFREACGWEPVAQAAAVREWLAGRQADMHSVLDVDLRRCRKIVYDLSGADGSAVSLTEEQRAQTERMFAELAAAGAAVGVGRYREDRQCYQGAQFTGKGEARTVHLGIDLFVAAGAPVYAPLTGVIHSLADNAKPFDYGPTVILRHEPAPGIRFFTLYGHLARASLVGKTVGQSIAAGERLGWIGDIGVNGGWIPHLHFQLTLDMLGFEGDFPGVCRRSQIAVWESLCPSPNRILSMSELVEAAVI